MNLNLSVIRLKYIWLSIFLLLPLPSSFAHDRAGISLGVWGTEIPLTAELVLYNNRDSVFKGIRLHPRNGSGVIILGNYIDYVDSSKKSSTKINVILKTKRCGLFVEEHDVSVIEGEEPIRYYLAHDSNEYIYIGYDSRKMIDEIVNAYCSKTNL